MNKKIFVFLIVVIFIVNILTVQSYALDEIFQGAKNFKDSANSQSPINQNDMQEVSNTLFNTFQIIGVVLALIVIIVLGIQFMTGSLETQAKIKESLIPLIIGIVIIFGAFTIWEVIVNLMQEAT